LTVLCATDHLHAQIDDRGTEDEVKWPVFEPLFDAGKRRINSRTRLVSGASTFVFGRGRRYRNDRSLSHYSGSWFVTGVQKQVPKDQRAQKCFRLRPWTVVAREGGLILRRLCPVIVLIAGLVTSTPATAQDRFVIFGDLQDSSEEGRLRDGALIERINSVAPAFSVFVGDIKGSGSPCSDELFETMRALFDRHEAPLIYTPGDNEWTDCWRAPAGGFDPAERKDAVVSLFTAPGESIGQQTLRLEQQEGQRENARWRWNNIVFATLHMTGSNNNLQQRDDAIAEHQGRDALNAIWLDETVDAASDAIALFLFTHANPKWEVAWWEPTGFDRFRGQLVEVAARFQGPIVVAHGDTHTFRIDKPFRGAPQMTRVEVFGPPQRGAVVVDVDPASPEVFRFAPLLLDP
jgi:hypothetical protein